MTDDPGPVVVQKSNRTTVITIASIFAIFVLFVAALWGAGFFTFSGSDESSKVVAAALALVGGLVAAIVSIIGIVLKHSIDQRTESRLQIEATRAAADRKTEADRANALQTQAEQRLNLEAAIRAVELLGSDAKAAGLHRAGALYALSSLNQHELTLDLASYLLARNQIEANVACTLIDRALRSGDEVIQRDAINILYENADRMINSSNVYVPDVISLWDESLRSVYVREWAVLATARILLARPLAVWERDFRGEAYTIIASLALAWDSEFDASRKDDAAAILNQLLAAFPEAYHLNHPTKTIDVPQIRSSVANKSPASTFAQEIVEQLRAWRSLPS